MFALIERHNRIDNFEHSLQTKEIKHDIHLSDSAKPKVIRPVEAISIGT